MVLHNVLLVIVGLLYHKKSSIDTSRERAQISSIESHLQTFVDNTRTFGRVDVVLSVQQNRDIDFYKRFIGENLVMVHISEDKKTKKARNIKFLESLNLTSYDGIFISRTDAVFKPLFREYLAAANYSRILFPFREWMCGDTVEGFGITRWRVPDSFAWIPSKYIISKKVSLDLFSNAYHDALRSIPPEVPYGFFAPGQQHDSDPGKEWNPLYSWSSRRERSLSDPPTWDGKNCWDLGPEHRLL